MAAPKHYPPRPLADLIDACLGPALAAQGFAASDVIASWPEIVGERLAAFTQPLKVEWPRKARGVEGEARAPASLVVRVEGAFALEMQHLAPLVIERINAHYGWRCIGRVVLKQGPVRRAAPKRAKPKPLDDATLQEIRAATAGVGDDALRASLDRLGRAVAGTSGKR
ncbi:DUF721 domain-containing protein [Salinarimonas soli]|uniref:DUF721 domain-containing protein n=1 Tax=Salinarimonas soli TaxID=1638099 RepID=A0A5B2V9M8_9HYPH|nr:DciA family protein [Salinarimonas soli]KAA2236213.1 DUF721 domain-containing protein [Salinarimonas soli]